MVYLSGLVVRTKKGQPDEERADRFFQEVATFLNKARDNNENILIIVGMDINTTLMRDQEGQIGFNIMDPKQGHNQRTRDQIHEFISWRSTSCMLLRLMETWRTRMIGGHGIGGT